MSRSLRVPQREGLAAVKLDVTSAASVAEVLAPFNELAALINCAGVIFRNGAEYEIETFQKVIDVNLTGTMRMCVAARPKLAAARGAIVNTASMLSFFGGPSVPAYTASKGGVAQLTKALAVAWAPEGIRVNAVAPGWIATELTRSLVEDEVRSAALLEPHTDAALGRTGRYRRRGCLSLFPGSTVHHRGNLARRWRLRSNVKERINHEQPSQRTRREFPTGTHSRRKAFLSWSFPTPSLRTSACGCHRRKMSGFVHFAFRQAEATG